MNSTTSEFVMELALYLTRWTVFILWISCWILVDAVVCEMHVNITNTTTVITVLIRRKPKQGKKNISTQHHLAPVLTTKPAT